jgi:UDP-N-acetyl-D-mannosaminuronic acid dehydrogenase
MNKFNVLVNSNERLIDVTGKMSDINLNNGIFGLAVVVDDNNIVSGIITDGDIRKFIARNGSLDSDVSQIYNKSPVCVMESSSRKNMYDQAIERITIKRFENPNFNIDAIIVTDVNGCFKDVVLLNLLADEIINKTVAVYGMGFVGLTLALVMAQKGYTVRGVDSDTEIIKNLKINKPHFFENGLKPLLETLNKKSLITFTSQIKKNQSDIYVIAVGTPVDSDYNPDLSYVKSVSHTISQNLKKGDLVVYRSTLPVGSTRSILTPILEESGLKAGIDFHVSFAPERTVEGKAIHEVQSLPQIIGGYSDECKELTTKLFRKITHSIVEVDSLEAAEMVKLINNTYRDLVFSFANEVSLLCEQYNINAFHLIDSANDGYPRNPIPKPSPGVGGICLSKDPHLYSKTSVIGGYKPILGKASRSINEKGGDFVYKKLIKYCDVSNKKLKDLKITIVGIGFKGEPETSDIRESMAINLIKILPNKKNLYVKDFVVTKTEVEKIGVACIEEYQEGFRNMDAVLFMNNHYLNNKFDYVDYFSLMNNEGFVFDGWNLFRSDEIEAINGLYYGTMGYMTKK